MNKTRRVQRIPLVMAVLMLLAALPVGAAEPESEKLADQVTASVGLTPVIYDADIDTLPYYDEIYAQYTEKGYEAGEAVSIPAADARLGKELTTPTLQEDGSLYLGRGEDYTWSFNCPKTGLYNVEMTYKTVDNNGSIIARSLSFDDKYLFQEMLNIRLDRFYDVPDGEFEVGKNGDEVRKEAVESFQFETVRLYDAGGQYAAPLLFYLEAGSHTLELGYISDEIYISSIRLVPPEATPTYAEMKAQYEQNGYKPANAAPQAWESEYAIRSNDTSVRAQSSADPSATKQSYGDFILNVFGTEYWSTGNQWAEWEFTVPETGLYTLTLKCGQWYNNGMPSYRQIAIDGTVPFKELLEYEIPFDQKWQNLTLSDAEGTPFQFYLEAGKTHTIRLTTKVGTISTIINILKDTSLRLSGVMRDIVAVTGHDIDKNYRYELETKIPTLMDDLKSVEASVQEMMDYMDQELRTRPYIYYSLQSMQKTLKSMIEKPDRITVEYSNLTTYQSNMGQWVSELAKNSLTLDKLWLSGNETVEEKANAGFFTKLYFHTVAFFRSFVKDYRNLDESAGGEGWSELDVWVTMGREQAEILRDMTSNLFSAQHKINARISIFPSGSVGGSGGVLYLAINSGTAPDVAIGVDSATPTEYAFRNATYDISKLEGYEEFTKLFVKDAFVAYEYEDGVYGVPCTQDFQALFYRKDILSAIGVGLPDTWDDVYTILPLLEEHGYQFFYPQNFIPFLLQHGGEMYTEDDSQSALGTPEAIEAFREFTELYTNYALPKAASFLNRFRTGEMPIGVGGFGEYVQFSVLAPELVGRWGIAPFPGTLREDGTVDRTVSNGSGSASIILADTEKAEEGWEYIQWWMSEDVQTFYAKSVETILGIGGRWNSANIEAFKKLPWDDEDLDTILEMWESNKLIRNIIGSYANSRYLGFAINDVIVAGDNPRDALEEAVKKINKEVAKKRQEFGK